MSNYYAAITTLIVFSMIAMIVCVNASTILSKQNKKYLRLVFISISVSAFCECFGTILQGTGHSTMVLHIILKAAELSIAPSIAFLIAAVIEQRIHKAVFVFLSVCCILEILSGFWGFIYKVDTNSVYTHQQFYWLYIASFFTSFVYAIIIFARNMKKYQYNGAGFFCLITLFMLFGIFAQIYDSDLKVVYIAITVVAMMLYIFTLEMILQNDELTGLINRRGYENRIAHFDEKCVVLMFDVDRFKAINDQYGHRSGDICLQEIGKALKCAYMNYGRCYRIGGDEFCVIVTKKTEQIEQFNQDFFDQMAQCREKYAWMPQISLGYQYFDPQKDNVQETLNEVDSQMYQFKGAHRNEVTPES